MTMATKTFRELKSSVKEYLASIGATDTALDWQTEDGYLVLSMPTRFDGVAITVTMISDQVIEDFVDIDIFCKLSNPKLVSETFKKLMNFNTCSGKYNTPIPHHPQTADQLFQIFKAHISIVL
jgi:hypothetical protein